MVKDVIDFLIQQDPQVGNAVKAEYDRQRRNIELIASENFVSEAVLAAASSVLTNKYAEGYPGKRYYGGCECVDVVENIARDRAKALFGADHVNVQPHSGASANYAVYQALCNVGDTVLGMNLDNGGHLTHGSPVNFSGLNYNIVPYGVDPKTHRIDYDQVRDLAKQHKPKMIIAGASAYPRIIDFKAFREIADEVGAYLFVDMAHIAGLVAAGLHPSPVPYADVVTTTTHKTLRGPRGGVILCKEEHAKKIDKAIFPGSQGGPLEHIIAAKAVALCAEGKANFLMKGILGTADLMRAVFNKEHGLRTSHLTTHCMFYEIPALGKMVILTDGGVNTFPDLEKKAEILENAAAVLQALGYEHINAACICGAEQVNPKVQSTVDADALSKMTDRWAKYNMDVCGPVALDLAVSKEACQHKHFSAPGAGDADILLVPNYEVGNGIGKAASLFGGAKNAGIILGAKVPIVLVSRSDSAESKLASIAAGSVLAHRMHLA